MTGRLAFRRPPSRQTPSGRRPSASSRRPAARFAVQLYPRAWRDRYGDELRALLDDSQAGLAAILSVAWRALPARIWPAVHLADQRARMQSTLQTVLPAWAALTAMGLVFAQLSQLQGYRPHAYPVVQWCYAIFDGALASSVLLAAAGGLPLWLLMLRQARSERRTRELAYLLLAVVAPGTYLIGLTVALAITPGRDASSPALFPGCALAGFAAAGLACAGPVLAMSRLRPRGPAVRLATRAAVVATATIVLATVASAIAATGLSEWVPQFAAYHETGVLACYLAIVLALAAVALVSAARGYRASVVSA